MRELVASQDIPRCVDILHVRPKVIVHGHAFFGVVYTRSFEIETVDGWPPAGGDQQHIALSFALCGLDYDAIAFPPRGGSARPYELHALPLEDMLHYLLHLGFLFWQE